MPATRRQNLLPRENSSPPPDGEHVPGPHAGFGSLLAFLPRWVAVIRQKLVGTCARCEIHIAVDPDKRTTLELLLHQHEASCQGGDRFDQVWMPFAISEYPVVEVQENGKALRTPASAG